MPWQVKELLTMKREFVMLAQQEGSNRAELCRRSGISRECGYKWLRAYQEAGESGLREKSRRPGSHPLETGREMEKVVLELRAKHPAWGGRKLKRRLENLGLAPIFHRPIQIAGSIFANWRVMSHFRQVQCAV